MKGLAVHEAAYGNCGIEGEVRQPDLQRCKMGSDAGEVEVDHGL